MARVKQEVIEQRAQKQRTSHHQQSLPSVMSPSTGVSPPAAPPMPPRISANVFSSGCIDLTLDDDTEDEEEKDEPLGQYVPPSHPSPVDLAAEEEDQGTEEKAEATAKAAVEEKEPLSVQEVEEPAQDEGEDTDTDVEKEPMEVEVEATAAPVESKPTPSFQRFSMSDVESDEDDELPVRPTNAEVEEEKKEEDDEEETETQDERHQPVVTGLRSMVQKVGSALGFMFGSQREDEQEDEVVEIMEVEETREEQEEDEIEEEEDEALPAVYEPPSIETTGVPTSPASDSGSAMDIDDDGDQPAPSEASASSVPAVAVVGASLEDGEIFEEGAVVKSPSEVKQAIEQELLAAKGAKKRPKKRGRKKNKRKAEVLLPIDTVDEFGRVVRPRVEAAASSPADQESQWTSPPKPSYPSALASSSSASPSGSASPSPAALLQTPPRPTMMMPPPLPRMPPPPQNNFPVPRGSMPPYPDEHIVRVNRHGSVEPFSIHHGGNGVHGIARPLLPTFPAMPLPPPPPVNGGFRYVPVTGFQPPPGPDTSRSFKRPLPAFMRDENEDDDAGMMDLDNLRAAALRTKRKTSEKDAQEAVKEDAMPVVTPKQSPPLTEENTQKQEENDPSLDALRAQLLKSMRPRKRLASNSQAASESSTTPPQVTTDQPTNSAETSKPTSPSPPQKSPVASLASSEVAPPLPESPMFRPLTAASQSIVIRFSLDDLKAKDRSDSFDDENAIAKYSRVVDEVRAKVASSDLKPKVLTENGVTKKTSPVKKSLLSPIRGRKSNSSSPQKKVQKPLVPTKTESPVKTTIEKCDEKKEAPDAAELPTSSPPNEVSSSVDVHAIAVPLAPAKPVVDEREACLASIREADEQLSRLDAEIAALRRVLVAKEQAAASAAAAASPPSIPVPVEI